jgi:hypothetical protein
VLRASRHGKIKLWLNAKMVSSNRMSCRFTFAYGQKGNKNTSKSINVDKRSKLHSWCSYMIIYADIFYFAFCLSISRNYGHFALLQLAAVDDELRKEISFSYWLNFTSSPFYKTLGHILFWLKLIASTLSIIAKCPIRFIPLNLYANILGEEHPEKFIV